MAQQFSINGTAIARITRPDWIDEAGDDQNHAGAMPLARWRRLVAKAEVLSATEFNTLRGLEGQRVSITVPPYGDRNAANYVTYYGAEFERLDGRHEGPVMTGVTAEFLVRV
jgi:hypothetical protein